MSYVVLARKWRPQTFADLTGQDHITRTLTNAINSGRVPHAMLFTGARGVGKTTSARLVAMALNCAKGPTDSPCGECDSCREIQTSSSPDVKEVDGASHRSIDNVRSISDGTRYKPFRDRYKIIIVDEVHMFTTEAFNALLKTIEEPPENVIFLFATTEAQKIPSTILSRCQRFNFRQISFKDLCDRLRFIADAEGLDIDDEVIGIVARQAKGGMRDALSLLDQLISYSEGRIDAKSAQALLGAADRTHFFNLSAAVLKQDSSAALQVIEELDSWGVDMAWAVKEWLAHLRDLVVISSLGSDTDLTSMTEREREEAAKQIHGIPHHHLLQTFDLMAEHADRVLSSAQPRWLFEIALLQLCELQIVGPIDDLVTQLRAIADGRKLPPAALTSAAHEQQPAYQAPATAPAPAAVSQPEHAAQTEPPEQPEPAQQPELTEQPEPTQQPELTEQPEPAQQPELTEQPEPAETREPAQQPELVEQPEPAETPESAEQSELQVEAQAAAPGGAEHQAEVQSAELEAPDVEPSADLDSAVDAAPPAQEQVAAESADEGPADDDEPAPPLSLERWRHLVITFEQSGEDTHASSLLRLLYINRVADDAAHKQVHLAFDNVWPQHEVQQAVDGLISYCDYNAELLPRIELREFNAEQDSESMTTINDEADQDEKDRIAAIRNELLSHPTLQSIKAIWPEARIIKRVP